MSRSFKALNIESDDESDIEIDDSKEIQIEEALKLYTTALKYHAAGPQSFDQAADAYDQLFASEIFKYPESQTELRRIELYGPLPEDDYAWNDVAESTDLIPASGLDKTPSSLPQILHLSHKNYAQFKLEYLGVRLSALNTTLRAIVEDAAVALEHFVEALDKDDSDLDLWRKTAAVGEVVDSKRIARFCLEAALEGDDDGLATLLGQTGLLESVAAENLRELVHNLQDQLSELQLSASTSKKRQVAKLLRDRLDAYKPIKTRAADLRASRVETLHSLERTQLQVPETWAEMAEIILEHSAAENRSLGSLALGSAIIFVSPSITAAGDQPLTEAADAMQIDAEPPIIRYQGFSMPTTIAEQFPGLDDGRPTTQPRLSPADANMRSVLSLPEETAVAMSLPSRKRSGEVAGLLDGGEEGRSKSRRTRARESTADTGDTKQALIEANLKWEYQKKLEELEKVDEWMFGTAEKLFEKHGVAGVFDAGKQVRYEVGITSDELATPSYVPSESFASLHVARSDFLGFLGGFNDQMAYVLLNGGDTLDVAPGITGSGSGSGFGTQPSMQTTLKAETLPNDGIAKAIEKVNHGWCSLEDAAWEWLMCLVEPGRLHESSSSYTQYSWPESLKTSVVRMVITFDASTYLRARKQLDSLTTALGKQKPSTAHDVTAEIIETIFEIHLDIFTLIKQANSGVDEETISGQNNKLRRWAELAREAMHLRSLVRDQTGAEDELTLRFFWATTFYVGADSSVTQDHVLGCMRDLCAIFTKAGEPTILLQNNAIMPELSLNALEQEKSRLTTKDFFLKVTSPEIDDAPTVIETLEPLLGLLETNPQCDEQSLDDVSMSAVDLPPDCSPELIRFLLNSEMSVRLLLWQRLKDAYLAIDYKPMVLWCYFNMVRLCLEDLKSKSCTQLAQDERRLIMLKRLRLMQTVLAKSLTLVQNADDPLECIDEQALRIAVRALGEALQLFQVFNVFEDPIRLGQSQPPTSSSGSSTPSFDKVTASLHDSQVHIWSILYHLLKDAIWQNPELYSTPAEDRSEFLRSVHRNLGIRGFCGASNRALVRMLRDEFKTMTQVDGFEEEQSQVLYDLYGINCFVDPAHDLMEHNCTHDAFVDRSAAMLAVDLLLIQAAKVPMKDLVKHTLKDTIDKVHGTVVRKKPSDDILRNREIYRAFLKSPINPRDLYDCLKGVGNSLSVARIPKEDAMLAAKGWYFLMGHISLSRFRSQKRNGPAPTEDLDIAIAFFNQDLEYSMDNWETWFRLAQAYDTKIEESVVWSAEKLNNSMPEIIQLQRTAIHCYIMATALANRSAELAFETAEKMTELYAEFANRLYSSSREPFNMLAFSIDDQERFMSTPTGVEKRPMFASLRVYTAWKLAKVLYQRALPGRERSWQLQYELGKVMWKMQSATDEVRRHDVPPPPDQVLDCFIRAIDLLPEKKDGREKREPILEPHYKLVTVVHKLVSRQRLSLEQARQALSHTPYIKGVPFPDDPTDWTEYALELFGKLRTADKSNWYHRIVARIAYIQYTDDSNIEIPTLRATAAKHELTQQLFTKTMVLQVWRPEPERAGRHFVYYARYTRFFVKILGQLNDRANLELLARRIRRRAHDVFEHSQIWTEICTFWLRMLRSHAKVLEGTETAVFSNMAHESFLALKGDLENWMQAQDGGNSAALDVLREVQELKKINGGLMKTGPIDDLIGDTYAYLFNTVAQELRADKQREEEEKQREEAARQASSPPRNPMMSLNHLMNMDGASGDIPKPASTATAVPEKTTTTEPAARKKIGVGRREIRTSAENCNQKLAAVEVKESARGKAVTTRVSVVIETNRNVSGETSADTSAPASIHDSADESELSELEEYEAEEDEGVKEEPQRAMFPGMATSIADSTAAMKQAAEERNASSGEEDAEMKDVEENNDGRTVGEIPNSSPLEADVKEQPHQASNEKAAAQDNVQ